MRLRLWRFGSMAVKIKRKDKKMGFEHKLYIVDGLINSYHKIIAEVDISRHDVFLDNINNLFTEKLDGYIYVNDEI